MTTWQLRSMKALANVAAVQPAIGVQRLRGVLGVLHARVTFWWSGALQVMDLEVSAENVGASEADLASRVAARVIGDVIHVGHIDELDVVAGHGTAHMTRARISQLRDGGSGAALGLAVALHKRAAHGQAEEIHDVAGYGRRACHHKPASAAKDGLGVLEDNLVPQPVCVSAAARHKKSAGSSWRGCREAHLPSARPACFAAIALRISHALTPWTR